MERESSLFSKGRTFDDLVKLSPAELEALRQKEVNALIDNAPEHLQKRLRGLQFEVDAKRKAHKSPLGACIAISRMMQDSLDRLHAVLQGEQLPQQQQSAEVVPFRARPQAKQNPPDQPAG